MIQKKMDTALEYKERLEGYQLSKSTRQQYLEYYKRLRKVIGNHDVTEPIAIAFLKDNPNSVCMAFLNDYIKWKRLPIVLEKKIINRKPQKSKRYISENEIKILGKWLKDRYGFKYKLMLYLAYECALRRKETIGFRLEFLLEDFKEWDKKSSLRVTINKASAKGEKDRKIILRPKLALAFYNYIKNNLESIRYSEHKYNVFQITKTVWHKKFKDAVRTCLNKDYTLHELRFSKATSWWTKDNFDIVTIQKLLGHVDIKTTQRYIDSAQEEALRRLERVYG